MYARRRFGWTHGGFQRATPHTPHHNHNHNDTKRHTTHNQPNNNTNQPTNQHTQQKHSNTQQHHIRFFFFFLLVLSFFPFLCLPFLSVCSVRSVFSLLVFVFYLGLFLCSPLFPMLCLVPFLCLCLFSLCFHGFPMKMKNSHVFTFFASFLSLLSFLLSLSTLKHNDLLTQIKLCQLCGGANQITGSVGPT